MVFSSVLFLFYFFPLTLLLYYFSGRGRNYVLLFLSLVFYLCGGIKSFPIIIVSILINYFAGLLMGRVQGKRGTIYRKIILALSLLADMGLLFYFKYFNSAFTCYEFLRTMITLLPELNPETVTLPIGISFFTFQGMSYIIDVYRGKVRTQKNIAKIALYISMFPQLIAGPIVRYEDICNEMDVLEKKRGFMPVSLDDLASGALRFITGLSKKVILADVLSESVDRIFSMDVAAIPTGMAWLGALFYTLQIYFDFSGYSDMAIGLGEMLGYSFPENFNLPYISSSVREFWRRWHITLSSWFRDYLYIPLGGNRRGNVYINLLIVFICTGAWHGSAWTFVIWGVWHGLFLVIERIIGNHRKNRLKNPPKAWLRIMLYIYTMIIVIMGWVIFRSDSLSFAVDYIKAMFGFPGDEFNFINTRYFLDARMVTTAVIAILVALGVPRRIYAGFLDKHKESGELLGKLLYPLVIVMYALALLMIINGNYSPFIYFRF